MCSKHFIVSPAQNKPTCTKLTSVENIKKEATYKKVFVKISNFRFKVISRGLKT